MKKTSNRAPMFVNLLLFVTLLTVFVSVDFGEHSAVSISRPTSTTTQRGPSGRRNLSLRPEAFNMARRLGTRFSLESPQRSLIAGVINTRSENRVFQMVREQTSDGEQVDILLAQSAASLRWDIKQGATSSGTRASGGDRELIEKLVFDSADHFVLAQLRGASYSRVAHNVSISVAGIGNGASVYDIVRIDDPERDEATRPESQWRLYYLNRNTGLIDRVVYDVRGESIQADFTDWTTHSGETFPARIVWSRAGERVMEITVTALTRATVE